MIRFLVSKNCMLSAFLVFSIVGSNFNFAFAKKKAPKNDQIISVTVSPIFLILSFLELKADFKIYHRISASFVAGNGLDETQGALSVLGASGQYHLLGDFYHGLQTGLSYQFINNSDDSSDEIPGYLFAEGHRIGCFIGYKKISADGFTLDTQLGVRYMPILPQFVNYSGGDLNEDLDEEDGYIPYINLNLGWSF